METFLEPNKFSATSVHQIIIYNILYFCLFVHSCCLLIFSLGYLYMIFTAFYFLFSVLCCNKKRKKENSSFFLFFLKQKVSSSKSNMTNVCSIHSFDFSSADSVVDFY